MNFENQVFVDFFEYGMVKRQYFHSPTSFNYARTYYHQTKIEKIILKENPSKMIVWGKRGLLLSLILGVVIFLPADIGISKVYAVDQILNKGTGGKYNLSTFKEKIFNYFFVKNDQNVRIWKLTEEGQLTLSLATYAFALVVVIPLLFPKGKISIPAYFPTVLPAVKTILESVPPELIKPEELICEPRFFTNLYDLLSSEEIQVILKTAVQSLPAIEEFETIKKL